MTTETPDSPDARQAAARHYVTTMPVVESIIANLAAVLHLTATQQDRVRELVRPHAEEIERAVASALIANFTAGEIELAARLMATKEGQAVQQKLPAFGADLASRVAWLTPLLERGLAGVK